MKGLCQAKLLFNVLQPKKTVELCINEFVYLASFINMKRNPQTVLCMFLAALHQKCYYETVDSSNDLACIFACEHFVWY